MKRITMLFMLLLACFTGINAQQPAKTKAAVIKIAPFTEQETKNVPGMTAGISCSYTRKANEQPFMVSVIDGATIKINNKIVHLKNSKTTGRFTGEGYEVKVSIKKNKPDYDGPERGTVQIKDKSGAILKVNIWQSCEA